MFDFGAINKPTVVDGTCAGDNRFVKLAPRKFGLRLNALSVEDMHAMVTADIHHYVGLRLAAVERARIEVGLVFFEQTCWTREQFGGCVGNVPFLDNARTHTHTHTHTYIRSAIYDSGPSPVCHCVSSTALPTVLTSTRSDR